MMSPTGTTSQRNLLGGAVLLLALVAGLLTGPASAAPTPALGATDCPAIMPKASIAEGQTGQGLTVVRGAAPQPFAVEVLGVLPNGIGAGRDMVIIEVRDLPGRQVIAAGGGIWAGMSGSPVYVNGKLLGAVAYGFSAAPSPIGGVTPAADMADLLTLSGAAARRSSATSRSGPLAVTLPKATRAVLATRANAAIPSRLTRLPVPLGVSGLSQQRLARLQSEATAAGLSVVTHAAGAARSAGRGELTRPTAGGNFAASISYGDVAAAGVGTTTYVCRSRALAFGHPFNFAGPSTYGADNANSLAIVRDDSFGSFKLATPTTPMGTIDQDRLAGIRANLAKKPATTPINTRIRNLNTTRSRTGVTRVTDQTFLGGLTPFAILANYDATFDEIGDGRANSRWTITGTRAGGKPFTVTRFNRWAARSDLAVDPAFDAALAVDALVNNEFEPVRVQRVDFTSAVTTTFSQLRITDMRVSVNGGAFVRPRVLRVPAGAQLRVRVTMLPFQSTTARRAEVALRVPANASGSVGVLEAVGGLTLSQGGPETPDGCLLTEAGCEDGSGQSLNGVIRGLTSAPRNDRVYANLRLESESGTEPVVRARSSQRLVVTGQRAIEVEVR